MDYYGSESSPVSVAPEGEDTTIAIDSDAPMDGAEGMDPGLGDSLAKRAKFTW
jgi:hypothetical protein